MANSRQFHCCSGATTNTPRCTKIVLDEGWDRDRSFGRVGSHPSISRADQNDKAGPTSNNRKRGASVGKEKARVQEDAICVGVMPCMQVLEDGRCILTFDCLRSISLRSLKKAIAWCSEHLENEKPEQKGKAFDFLLAGHYAQRTDADVKLQADLISALLYAWSSCVRRSPKCNRCAGYSS